MDAEPTGRLLVDLRIVEQRVDAFASTALEHATRLRPAERQLHPRHPVGALALGRSHAQHVTVRECDQDELRVDELVQPACHQTQEWFELELGGERVADLVQRLELAQPPGRAFVQASVLDRNSGLGCEQLGQLRVLVGEVLSTLLLRQIEVSVRDSTKHDRHTEERLHRRVVLRKAHRAWIVCDVVEPQRLRVADQNAQDAAPVRQITDRRVCVSVDSCRQESLERLAGPVDHAESCVAGAGDLGRRLDDALKQCVERKLRAERDARVHEHAQAAELVCLGAHEGILAERLSLSQSPGSCG